MFINSVLPFLPRFFCCYFNFATFALLSNGEQNRSRHFFAFPLSSLAYLGFHICRSVFCHLSSLVLLFKILSLLLRYSSIIVNLCFFWVGFEIFFRSFGQSFTKICTYFGFDWDLVGTDLIQHFQVSFALTTSLCFIPLRVTSPKRGVLRALEEEEEEKKTKRKSRPVDGPDNPMEEDVVNSTAVFCIRLKQPRSNLQHKMSVLELCCNFRYEEDL